MRKKVISILVLVAISMSALFSLISCRIPTDESGFQYYGNSERDYDFFIGHTFNPQITEVVIPSTFKNKPVGYISNGFRNNYKLNGDGWRTGQTDKIKSITIPSSIKEIMPGAFQDCISLETIIISNDNPIYKSEGNCVIEIATNKLIATCGTSVLPQYVTTFENGAFDGAYILNNVSDGSIFYFNKVAISYNGNPGSRLSLEPDTTGITTGAFSGLLELESIILPPSVTYIGDYAFNNCTSLTSIFIPSSVESIGNYAFYNCPSLTIYIEATEKQDNWYYYWNQRCPVVWNYDLEMFLETINPKAANAAIIDS